MLQFHVSVAVSYIDSLLTNMNSHFSDVAVKFLVCFPFSIQHCCHQKKDFSLWKRRK